MLPSFGWQSLFVLGGVITVLSLPFVFVLLPESPEFLLSRQPPGALQRINRIMRGMGQAEIAALPSTAAMGSEPRGLAQIVAALRKLFSTDHRVDTLLLWVAFFMSLLTLYFLQNWVPQLVANAGQTDSQAFSAGTILNLGLFVGMASVGYFADHFGLRRVIATYLAATALALLSFSYLQGATAVAIGLGVAGVDARRFHRPLCGRRADLPGGDPDHRDRLGDRRRAARSGARPVCRGRARRGRAWGWPEASSCSRSRSRLPQSPSARCARRSSRPARASRR